MGAYLSKFTVNEQLGSSLSSFKGQTNSIFEPHEFSKFWQKYNHRHFPEVNPPEYSVEVIIKNLNRILNGPLYLSQWNSLKNHWKI